MIDATIRKVEELLCKIEVIEKVKKKLVQRLEHEIEQGHQGELWFIQEGKLGARKIIDSEGLQKALISEIGVNLDDITITKLVGVPALEKTLKGNGEGLEVLKSFIVRDRQKSKLVRRKDASEDMQFMEE